MKKVIKVYLFLILFVQLLFAGTTHVTLQNGLFEYNGCEDTYIISTKAAENFSDADTLYTTQAYW